MARVELSGLISNISGKLNGSVFQRNQSGLIIRNQAGKINSNTARSNFQRTGIAQLQNDWKSLDDATRNSWENYSRYLNLKQKRNPTLNINGHQLFIRINSIRYSLQDVSSIMSPYLLSIPIFAPLPQPLQILTLDNTMDLLWATFNFEINLSNNVVILLASRPLTGSQISANQKLTLMRTATTSVGHFDFTSYYTEVYGRLPAEGEWLQIRAALWDSTTGSFSNYTNQRLQYP